MNFNQKKFASHLNRRDPLLQEGFEKLIQDKIFSNFYTDPTFDNISLNQQDLVYARLKKLSDSQIISVSDVIKNPTKIFEILEFLTFIDCSLVTKFHINYILFGGALQLIANPKKIKSIIQPIDNLDIIGCYALSEQDSGNNHSTIQTECKFKEKSNSFVLKTPNKQSIKTWVANGYKHANYCIVYAKLYINKKSEGIHPFLVKLRETNGQICKNIKIKEMKNLFGIQGMDFAQIEFNNHEIPIQKLISGVAKVQDNKFHSSLNIKQRFDHYYQIMPYARFSISMQMIAYTKFAFLIGMRYASQRKVIDQNGLSTEPILNFELFQMKLFPLLAKTICLNLAFNESAEIFSYYIKRKLKIGNSLHLINIILKVQTTENARDCGIALTERLGGQGYLGANRISELIQFSIRGILGEGDNSLLMQRLCREIIINYQLKKIDLPTLVTNPKNLNKIDHFTVSESFIDLLKLREIQLIEKLRKKTKEETKYSQKTLYQLWSFDLQHLVQITAKAHSERCIAELCYLSIVRADDEIKDHLKIYFKVYVISIILQNIEWYQINQSINKKATIWLYKDFKYYLGQIKNIVLQTVQSFNIPEILINAPIAQDIASFYEKKDSQQSNIKPHL